MTVYSIRLSRGLKVQNKDITFLSVLRHSLLIVSFRSVSFLLFGHQYVVCIKVYYPTNL